ncbi:MAG: PAS domain S-box protein, partial [Campylobacteraceae bacterium]|nr:PAS domain S-box protein [Campylobacteraceae bacterium]
MKKIQGSPEVFEAGCYTAFFDAIDEMIFIKDDALRYVFANRALLDFFGRENATFLGKKDNELMDESHAKGCENSDFMALKEQKTVLHYETIAERIYQTRKFPFSFKDGQKGLGGIIFDVTSQHKTLESLKFEKERIEVILEASDIGLWDWDIENDVVHWDAKCFEMLGYLLDAFPLHYDTWVGLMHQDNATMAQEEVRRLMEAGETFETQFQLRKNDGSYAWIEGRGRVVERCVDGSPKRIVGTHINKTQEKHKEIELANVYDQLGKIFENNAAGIFVVDDNRNIIITNQHFCEMLGYTKEELVGQNVIVLHVNEEAYKAFSPILLEAKVGHKIKIEYRLKHKEGKIIWCELHGNTIELQNHQEGVIWNVLNISERKKAEDALSHSEAQFKSLVSNIPGVTYRCLNDESWTMLYMSHEIDRLSGYPSSDFLHNAVRSYESVIYADDVARVRHDIEEVIEKKSEWSIEYRIVARDGGIRWAHEKAKAIFDEEGKVLYIDGFILDITEEKHSKEALIKSQQTFKQYIESAPYAVFITDRLGYYRDVNLMAEHLSGYSKEELLTMSIADLVPIKDLVKVRKHFIQLEKEGITKSTQMQYRPKDGELRYWSVTPVKLSHEQFLTFAYDITEQQKASDALVQSNRSLEKATIAANAFAEQAQMASLAKSNFLANMSHEIRTPMNAIMGLSELLSDTTLSPKQSEYIQKIISSSSLLLGIINDILDFSKIEAGKIEVEKKPVYLQNILMHLRTMFEENASKKDVYFGLNIHDSIPSIVLADELKLIQILTNFLSNAFKFTAQGSVILSVECLHTKDKRATLRFSVDDTGIGMSEVQLEKLFIPFSQADVSITRKYGGTGLGLSIAKRLAEAMGGTVGVLSHEKRGTSFYLEVECEVLEWGHIFLNTSPYVNERKEGLEGLRILVVEDNSINQEVVKAMLERVGISVDVANNGKEGVEYFLRQNFDAILMDIQMPVMGGYEASRQIREHDAHIPI